MDGRVLQVNVSPGGVPKLPVERAWVGKFGVEGDRQQHDTVHGGPHRAVALLGIEAIERVQADGHPIEPGSVGENLTTFGLELASLPVGTRLAVGDELLLEISSPANPCNLIGGSFRGGKSGRISVLTHPADTRMYARTLVEGEVRPGDPIRVLPPAHDTRARDHGLLERIEAVTLDYEVLRWRAAALAGFDVRVIDDGELAMVASAELPSAAFNLALGHRMLRNLTHRMVDFFGTHGTVGRILAEEPPVEGATIESAMVVAAADVTAVPLVDAPVGVTIREIEAGEAERWGAFHCEVSGIAGREREAWLATTRAGVGSAGQHHLVAEEGGEVIGVAALFTRRRIGLLAAAAVSEAARGRGLQRALISARARIAADRRCQTVAASTVVGGASEHNLAAMGLEILGRPALYRLER
jgi:MOSC domain-containing protein YiiM/GNAT superfamily N-acetyltransferase